MIRPNIVITAVFIVFWSGMASMSLYEGDWFYGGLNMAFVLWNSSYLVDKVYGVN